MTSRISEALVPPEKGGHAGAKKRLHLPQVLSVHRESHLLVEFQLVAEAIIWRDSSSGVDSSKRVFKGDSMLVHEKCQHDSCTTRFP